MSLSVNEFKWLSHSVSIAQRAKHSQWRVGAIIVKNGRVLGSGTNRYRNNPARVDISGVSYHAEEVAIRKAGDVDGATIYVGRITRSGKIGLALPCPRCQDDLFGSGISQAVWTEPNGWGRAKISELLEGSGGRRTELTSQTHPLLG